MSETRWTDETAKLVLNTVDEHFECSATLAGNQWVYSCDCGQPVLADDIDDANDKHHDHRAERILAALASAGLLRLPYELTRAEASEAWRHNAKLHIDMRHRIQRVATHAAAEQRSLSWVADELTDTLSDPVAWAGETAYGVGAS